MGLAAFNRMRRQQEEANKNKDDSIKSPPVDGDPKELKEMTVEELTAYAKEKSIDIGNSTSIKGILKKIQDAENVPNEKVTE